MESVAAKASRRSITFEVTMLTASPLYGSKGIAIMGQPPLEDAACVVREPIGGGARTNGNHDRVTRVGDDREEAVRDEGRGGRSGRDVRELERRDVRQFDRAGRRELHENGSARLRRAGAEADERPEVGGLFRHLRS